MTVILCGVYSNMHPILHTIPACHRLVVASTDSKCMVMETYTGCDMMPSNVYSNYIIGVSLFLLLGSCQLSAPSTRPPDLIEASPDPSNRSNPYDAQYPDPSSNQYSADHSDKATQDALAYLNGRPIRWDDIQNSLLEAQGGPVLAEIVLERLVRKHLAEAGLRVGPKEIEWEQSNLLAFLHPDPDQAQRLASQLKQRRGLGQKRYARLLEINAGLRQLIQDQVEVSQPSIQQEFERIYGPRYEARIVVCKSAAQAGRLVGQARSGESFTELAVRHSLDPSADRGGLLSPISPVDATYPQAIRTVLSQLEPGQVSDPIALEDRFVILRLERKIDANAVKLADVKENLTRQLQRRIEAMLMGRLTRTMLSDADLIILHPTLKMSWQKGTPDSVNTLSPPQRSHRDP